MVCLGEEYGTWHSLSLRGESLQSKEKKMAYQSKTDKELRDLAFDIVAGNVFHDQMIHPNENAERMIRNVFLPLSFINKEQAQEMMNDEVSIFYEYINRAGDRSVNGYPTFFSVNMLDKKDLERLQPYIDKVVEFREQIEIDD